MHDTALAIGEAFFKAYASVFVGPTPRILDVGALDVNGGLRRFAPPGAHYVGLDQSPGAGVDVVKDPDAPFPFGDGAFDAVVSSSALEHDPMFWVTFLEMARVVRPGGVIYINAPSAGHYHAFPLDCWRFYPDAPIALERWAQRQGVNVEKLESFTLKNQGETWNDAVMLFSRSGAPAPEHRLYRFLSQYTIDQKVVRTSY